MSDCFQDAYIGFHAEHRRSCFPISLHTVAQQQVLSPAADPSHCKLCFLLSVQLTANMLARQATQSPHMHSSKLASSSVRLRAAGSQPLRQTRRFQRHHAIEEKRDTAGSEVSSSPETLSQEQLAKLAELRRQRADAAPQMNSNIVAGAIEEAQLISWPTPGKALLDTVLVLAIVSVSGFMLFTLNILFADASNWWYSH